MNREENWLKDLVRPEIWQLQAYSSARSEYNGTSQIQLNANENPWPPYGTRDNLNRYPEPQPELLIQRLAEIYQVKQDQLLITRGMDEAIDILIRVFCNLGKDFIVTAPETTFSYYKFSADINGIKTVSLKNVIPLPDAKIIFVCTPNNPTGESVGLEKIVQLCEKQEGIVAIDEAYIEFSDLPSATTLLSKYKNLIVMRTLSKAYALAGERIGVAIAHPAIIEILKKVIPPYPIAKTCAEAALKAISPIGLYHTQKNIALIKEQREYLRQELLKCKEVIEIYSSDANFLLVIFKNPTEIYQKLKSKGIIIRNRSQEISGALRITIGTPQENELLLCALEILKKLSDPFRQAQINRKTKETEISCEVIIDGKGISDIKTGIGFFNHMLELFSKHSGISINIRAIGDLHVDAHHTTEDVAIVLGSALKEALDDKFGIERYGFVLPMDETEVHISIDLSRRPYCSFEANFNVTQVGDFPTEMVKHFFESLSQNLGATIHIKVKGENTHHMIEGCFKCFARAIKQAIYQSSNQIPSTKGLL